MIDDAFPLFTIITTTIALSYVACRASRLLQRLGVVMLVIAAGILLGNLGVVPQGGEVYDPMITYLIPLSIALLLFRLDFRELRMLRSSLLLYYCVGAIGSIVGGIVAWALFGERLGDAARLTGQLTASYIGGGENAVAVAEALGLRQDNPNLFSAAFAADNIVTAMWMIVGLTAPIGFSRFFSNEISQEQLEAAKEHSTPFTAAAFLPSCFYSLTIASLIVWVSMQLALPVKAYAALHQIRWLQFNTSILWVTTLALVIAQTPLRKHLQVAYSLGMLFFLYFFFSMGAVSSISEIMRLGPTVFAFTLTVVGVHAIIILIVGRLTRGDMAAIFIASQCNIGGPGTAVALAEANNWPHMIVPSILLGVLGYAIANYIGIMVAQLLW
ncbi:MAG: DUF819 family protein [Deltaproteobacteria bacterium]|nr:DUF819 family protein [Deltaproteobacteria bacterium]